MDVTFAKIAAVMAGLAIIATGFTVRPRRGLLKGVTVAVAAALAGALLIMLARSLAS
jgi:hypothetical protein